MELELTLNKDSSSLSVLEKQVQQMYENDVDYEWLRLGKPHQQLEFLGTMHLCDRYFPKEGHILDIGCGPGRYSIALLERGYQVSLLDLTPALLQKAQEEIHQRGLKAQGYFCQSAKDMSLFEDDTFDSALLAGPLYHLFERQDRLQVLKEAHRILKSSGVVLCAYCNTYCLPRSVLGRDQSEFLDISEVEEIFSLQSLGASAENNKGRPFWFSTPEEALQEVEECGFTLETWAGVEGCGSSMRHDLARMLEEYPQAYSNFLDFFIKTIEHPAYKMAAEHIVIVARKK